MAWTKSPQFLIELFALSLPEDPRLERRKMFGYPVVFVNGNMAAGLFGDQVFARLDPADRAILEAAYGPHPFTPRPGRSSGRYSVAPEAVMEDEAAVARFIGHAIAFTTSLPPKVKRPK